MATLNRNGEDLDQQTTLLLVDDDSGAREVLAEYFASRGFTVLEAQNAEAGRQLSEDHDVSIAIIDLHMPGEHGLSLCKFLQEEKSTPVIILTGEVDPLERVVGLEIGADDFISKPFELREVLARTRSVLRRSRNNPTPTSPSNPIEALLVKSLSNGRTERLLLAIMFCDIVNSTAHAERLGDEAWTKKLKAFEDFSRGALNQAAGLPVKWMGDGLLAVFTTPGRALRAAKAMHQNSASLGIQLRIGIHCGECERQDQDLAGIAVHIAARTMNEAEPGQTMVTSTVREVMTGSQVEFVDRHVHNLKGIGEPWQLYSVS